MTRKENIPIYNICWLNHAKGGMIGTYYEPETKEELIDLCRLLYKEGKDFDIIGHTSNIYFLPNYNVDIMVSTRKVKNLEEHEDYILADCGVSVSSLSRKMVEKGIKGFEGLIDLPGTVAASVYGNASCYGCSINSLVENVEYLNPNGEICIINQNELKLNKRTSVFKKGEILGIILSVKLHKNKGNAEVIKKIASRNHYNRINTQPSSKDNLGSIYSTSVGWSHISVFYRFIANIYCLFLLLKGEKQKLKKRKLDFILQLLGAKELQPYVYGWNRFIWKDEKSHKLFWKFHEIHQKMFKNNHFEIEIKGEK